MSGTSFVDTVKATISTGTGTKQAVVTLSSASGISGTFVPVSPAGSIGASPLAVYNWDPASQLAGFLAAYNNGQGPRIVAVGDSTTLGFGSAASGFRELSYPAELTQALSALGVSAQDANFLGQGNENGANTDQRVTLSGGASYVGLYDAGGQVINTSAAGQAVSFSLDTPGNYNQLSVSYVDSGSGSVTVSVDGTNVGTLQFGNSGKTLSQSIAIPAGLHGQVTLTANTASPTYIQGVSFAETGSNQVQVFNAGIGGWGAGNGNISVFNGQVLHGSASGFGQVAGSTALAPNLALVDLGLNDITGFTNNGVPVPTATIVSNLEQIIATYRSVGCDVILVIPHPFSDPTYAAGLPALRAALEQVSLSENVPIIDLSATYGNNFAALSAAGLMSDNLHPDATLYADIGTQIANLLANTLVGTGTGTAATVQGTAGNDTLSSSAATATLIGDGGNDTYDVAAGANDTLIINGTSASVSPAGTLDLHGLSFNQLWFAQSGENLVISVLGTGQSIVVQNWFQGAGSELASITTSDGTLSAACACVLTAAMQAYMALNPSFNPATASVTNLENTVFAGPVASAVQTNWASSGSPPCFCPGTLIATPDGHVAVEMLRIGDMVTTLHAGPQRIKWIGRRHYKGVFANTHMVLPVCIAPDAIAEGVPARALCVSPGHAIALDGWLVYAARLVNQRNITQLPAQESVTYFHIELETHEVILAEGCPVETYREIGQRRQFENAAEYVRLYPGPEAAPSLCLPRLEEGFALDALLRRLGARARLAVQPGQGNLRGFVDVAGPRRCAGWAQAEAAPEVPVCLDIYVDQRRAARVLANRYRGDLRAAGLGSGNHGFELELPEAWQGSIEVRRVSDQALLRFSTEAGQG